MRRRTVVDEGGGAEPQLGAVLPGGVHDAEVVLPMSQQQVLLVLRQLGDAAHQVLDLIVPLPGRTGETSRGVRFVHRGLRTPRSFLLASSGHI